MYQIKVRGRMHDAPTASLGYYGKLYSTGDMVRVVAQEHTGLLERADREKVERSSSAAVQNKSRGIRTSFPALLHLKWVLISVTCPQS